MDKDRHITVIESTKKSIFPDFREIWKFRQLLFSLAWRDLRVKFAQTYIGMAWVFLNPIINIAILSFVFGIIVKADTDGIPPILYTVAGLSAWTYFSTLLNEAGNSIIGAQSMIKKIYFPRLTIPLSKALSGLVNLGVTLLCLLVAMIYYGIYPSSNIIWFPLFLLLAIVSGLAGGILTSALTIRYRDFKFIIPMLVRVGLYITPIAYSASMVPEQYKFWYYLNPMAGVVEGFRWSLFGTKAPDNYMIYSILLMLALFILSLVLFSKMERKMADII